MNNFEIISSKEVSKKIKGFVSGAYRKNKKVFGRVPKKKFKVIICHNLAEWKKECKYYYFPFGLGTVLRDGTLIAKSHELIKKSRQYSDKQYALMLDHEMNHVFFVFFYKMTKPVWILEGLANVLGAKHLTKKEVLKRIKKEKVDYKILDYRYLERKFKEIEAIRLRYSTWRYFIEYITKNKPNIIVKFMDEYVKNPTIKNYKRLFLKFFKTNEKEKFEEFITSL